VQLPLITALNQRTAGPGGPLGTPAEIVAWATARFNRGLVVTTGFGMEGCAMIDIIARLELPLAIRWIDTGFLFDETLELKDRLKTRYPNLTFIRHATDITPDRQSTLFGPELWRTDPDQCCQLRKVEPMRELLHTATAWMTAVRRDQSADRASLDVVQWDWMFEVVKICPLAGWSRDDVWTYVRDNQVPYSELHDRGYPSFGCTHCTKPVNGVAAGGYSRDGRWSGTTKTECGLHRRPLQRDLRSIGPDAAEGAQP